jgi:PucR C-terminal helix-turn-helix domain
MSASGSVSGVIEQFAPVAEELERVSDDLIERITAALREEIPSFRPIASTALREFVSLHVRRGLEASRGDATPTEADLEEAAVIGREAARFGIPAEELLQSMRVGVRIFWLECVELATQRRLDPATLIAAAELIWAWADAVGLAAVRGHRGTAVEEAVYLERRRCSFLLGILQGSVTGADLRAGAELYGMALDRKYVPVRARSFGPARSASQSERALRHVVGPAEAAVFCPLDDDIAGILPSRPTIDDPNVLVGVGRPAQLTEIGPSYADAVRALEVAARFGLRGDIGLDDLSLRTPITSESALGERLVARYLGPLRDGSQAGADLERTVHAYLDNGFRGDATAAALHIHMNTLRKRLQRIEQLAALSFRDPAQIAELWWALQYDQISR